MTQEIQRQGAPVMPTTGHGHTVELHVGSFEAVEYSSGDVTFSRPVGLLLSAAATVVVDGAMLGTEVALPLQAGFNPILIKKVYTSGTDAGITMVAIHNNPTALIAS